IIRNVHPLFYRENRIRAFLPGRFDLTDYETDIIIYRFQQVIGIVIRDRTASLLLQMLFDQMFCQCMASGTFCRIRTLLILKYLAQHQRGWAMDEAVCRRWREPCMSAHQSASASAIRAA